jgi:hypothetical protein
MIYTLLGVVSLKIDDILLAESGLEKVMGDIVRVLSICMGALWIRELYMEIDAFYRSLDETPPKQTSVEEALSRLEDMGIIEMTPAIKATMGPEGEKTVLVRLLQYNRVVSRIRKDSRLADYIIRYKRILGED